MKSHLLLFMLPVAAATLLLAQTEPVEHPPYYQSECWRGAEAYAADGWTTDVYPDTGLFAICVLGPNEPAFSYPFHSGVVIGVSDTAEVRINLKNRNQAAYSLSGVSPENWFTPVLYPNGVDIWKAPSLTLPATFGWRFDHWVWEFELQTPRPTSIPSEYDNVNGYSYSITYYCWGLPAGRYQLMMKKTAQAPPSFKLLKSSVVPVWVTKPTSLADTIAAYAACYWRADEKRNKSSTGYWVNQILAKNPFSIPGYTLKANRAAWSPPDTVGYYASIDSALAIINRYGDPLLPDSANMTGWIRIWYEDRRDGLEAARYNSLTGRRQSDL